MAPRITEILNEIHVLEEELAEAVKTYEHDFFYKLEEGKVRFDEAVHEAHSKLKIHVFKWILNAELRNVLSAPFIYPMIIPFAFLDLTITIYQAVCFRLYRIPMVDRKKFIAIDRYHLKYLNGMEKLNCVYCGYVNGLIAYMREIVARTEQYWCPIKHARKILDPHRRYARFADFGDPSDYHEHQQKLRKSLREDA